MRGIRIAFAFLPLASCGGGEDLPSRENPPITIAQSCPLDTRAEIPIAFIATSAEEISRAGGEGIFYACEGVR